MHRFASLRFFAGVYEGVYTEAGVYEEAKRGYTKKRKKREASEARI
jgi:hypothetical protein